MPRYVSKFVTFTCLLSLAALANAQGWTPKPYKIPVEMQKLPTETEAALRIGFPPTMPARATRSGYCCMTADISIDGETKNIKKAYCSEKIFKKPSKEAMKNWNFTPAVIGTTPVEAKKQMFRITFHLADERGNFLPDLDGKLSADHSKTPTVQELCRADLIS